MLTCLPGGQRGARPAAGGRQERPEELLHQPDPQRPAAAGGAEPERGGPLLAPSSSSTWSTGPSSCTRLTTGPGATPPSDRCITSHKRSTIATTTFQDIVINMYGAAKKAGF